MKTTKSALYAASICTALLAFGPGAGAASAATANFQGLCAWNANFTQFTCNFDGQRPASAPSSCPGSFIWKYLWDFGDGTSTLTGSPTTSHSYPRGSNPLVNLKVICWNGQTPEINRVVCSSVGVPGCIQVNGTWN